MPVYHKSDGQEVREHSIDEPLNPNGKWIVLLHGGYGNPFDFRLISDTPSLFPDSYIFSLSAAANDNRLWWSNNGQKDLLYLQGLITNLKDMYNLDYANGVVIGVSNGAMMALRLVNKLPFAKVVAVSGTYNAPESFTYTGDILLINSVYDKIIPYNGNQNNNSITDTLSTMRATANVQAVPLTQTKTDSNFLYHTWNNIKELTDLNQLIVGFAND